MSYTVLAAWSHPVSLSYYTERGQRCGAIMSGRITTIAMSRSGQLGLCYTIEPNCSSMSACLAGAPVIRDRALETWEPSCVPGAAKPFFIPVAHNPLGSWGTWQHRSSPLREARPEPRGSTRAHLGREARSEVEEHVVAPELSSQGGRSQSHGTRGSAGANLGREARSRAEEHVAAPGLNSARRRDPGLRDTWQYRSPPRQEGEVQGCRTR
jgi:hypothetical protein